jgi:hypothetical protein
MTRHRPLLLAAFLTPLAAAPVFSQDRPAYVQKTQSFDRDPGWEGHNNNLKPKVDKVVKQDFDFSLTNFAGKEKGEIGGTLWRSPSRAYYAAKIPKKTLNDKMTASGTFALTATAGSSGAFFGWFNSDLPGEGRQCTLGFHFAGQGAGTRLSLRLVTGTNQSCGAKVTPWEVDKNKPKGMRKRRPPDIKNDGTRYTWTFNYDPQGNGGNGHFQFTIKSNSKKPQEFENKTFTVNLPNGYRNQATTFDRFGLMNTMKPGNPLTIYFDDVTYDGVKEDFSKDPGWIGVGNHDTYQKTEETGAHKFGYSEKSKFAGGGAGEIGGMMWRAGLYAYYADRVGPFSLEDRLEASGKIVLNAGPPDSVAYFGWFNGTQKEFSPTQAGNFVGVKIGAPTKVGHYFLPAYATALPKGHKIVKDGQHAPNINVERSQGPKFVPQTVLDWKLVYNPAGNGGKGLIEATLGKETVTLPLRDGDRAKGATMDRFGLFTGHRGGSYVRLYLDDLKYTAARQP